MSETQKLTPEQIKITNSRDVAKGELIKGGATTTELGHFVVTASQEGQAKTEEFLHTTQEGLLISGLTMNLIALREDVGQTFLGEVVIRDKGVRYDPNLRDNWEDYATDIGLHFPLDEMYGGNWGNDDSVATAYKETLNTYIENLDATAGVMAMNPNLRMGTQLAIQLGPSPGHANWDIDGGWSIDTIQPDGQLLMTKPGYEPNSAFYKAVSSEELNRLNPPELARVPVSPVA